MELFRKIRQFLQDILQNERGKGVKKKRNNKKKYLCPVCVLLLLLSLTGCGQQEGTQAIAELEELPINDLSKDSPVTGSTLTIGSLGTTNLELLNEARQIMEEEGILLEVKEYDDPNQLNQDVLDGKIAGHLFAHAPYIDSYNTVNEVDLTSVGVLWYEVFGIYGGLKDNLTSDMKGATIAIPHNAVEQARALLFLQELGYLTLAEGMGPAANISVITENEKELIIEAVSEEDFKTAGDRYDYLVCGGYTASICGYDAVKAPLKTESISMPQVSMFGTHLVTTSDKTDSDDMKALQKAFKSDKMQAYLKYVMKGTVATK